MVQATCMVINIIGKGLSVVSAGHNIYSTCHKGKLTTSDYVDMTAQSIFIVAQTADLTLQVRSTSSSESTSSLKKCDNIRLGTNIAAGLADVTRVVTHKKANNADWGWKDTFDIVGVIAFRCSDIFQTTLETHKSHQIVTDHHKAIENTATVAGTVGQVVLNRNSLLNGGLLIWSGAKRSWKWISNKSLPKPVATSPTLTPLSPAIGSPGSTAGSPEVTEAGMQKFVEGQGKAEAEFNDAMQSIVLNWKNLQVIPAPFDEHAAFPKCKISNKAIRHILVPNFNSKDRTLIFDKYSVNTWLTNHSGSAPPGWPSDKPFAETFLMEMPFLQGEIDDKLEALAKEFAAS